jgi:hypothetical protein
MVYIFKYAEITCAGLSPGTHQVLIPACAGTGRFRLKNEIDTGTPSGRFDAFTGFLSQPD